MEVAAAYLGDATVPYKILPADQNFFSNLPVNWKYGENSIGGMLIVKGDGLSGEKALISLLQDQAAFCNGKNGTTRLTPTKGDSGTYYGARGACETAAGAYSASYTAAEGNGFLIILVELLAQQDANSTPSTDPEPETNGGLLAKFNPTR